MIRGILFLVLSLVAAPLVGQDEKLLNPFEIVLSDRTIEALARTPEGLFWPFGNQSVTPHDGAVVAYDPTQIQATNWVPNDGSVRYPYSLDLNDEILANIKATPEGLSALIAPEDRGRVTGVLLRYNRSALLPDTSITPVDNASAKPESQSMSILNQNTGRTTNNLNNSFQGGSPSKSQGSSGLALDGQNQAFYAERKLPVSPQTNDSFASRQPNQFASNSLNRNEFSPDRFALNNDSLMAPPQRTVVPSQSGYTGTESAAPMRRVTDASPQIGYSDYQASMSMDAAAHLAANNPMALTNNIQMQLHNENQALKTALSEEAKKLTGVETKLLESKQRSLFLLFMLFLCVGLCIYLAWLARGFYFRYSELADELRETFTTTG